MLTAIAPIVGTARVATALGKIADALEIELEIAEVEAQNQNSTRREPALRRKTDSRRRAATLIRTSSQRDDASRARLLFDLLSRYG